MYWHNSFYLWKKKRRLIWANESLCNECKIQHLFLIITTCSKMDVEYHNPKNSLMFWGVVKSISLNEGEGKVTHHRHCYLFFRKSQQMSLDKKSKFSM